MGKKNRAERRHHHDRMLEKVKHYSYYWYGWRNEEEKLLHMKKTAENRKPCSCSGCCNRRRSEWAKAERLSMQERRMLEYDKE